MPFISQLPADLEDATALIKRRGKAKERKDQWQSLYMEAYRYAMPARETFTLTSPGQEKNNRLFDSTLQELTYEAANTTCALLFPPWSRWAVLAAGGAVPKEKITKSMLENLQKATDTFFDFLHNSNFATVINECSLDLMVGTGAIDFDEGDDIKPFVFSSIPLSAIEIEEGPDGTAETTYMLRRISARNLLRTYPGLQQFDLSPATADKITSDPDAEIEVIQAHIFHPDTKRYFGVVVEVAAKNIIWRYDYEESCPTIVARATKSSGEIYGRGRVLQCLSDARSLDKMQEFVLRQAAVQVAPPMTGVSDGVLNPYTATIQPNVVIPVASNDKSNPSLQVLDVGGNFNLSEKLMDGLRTRLRRAMLGPEGSEGQPLSATEISIADRNRLWAMNGEFSRIQSELLARIVARGVYILQRRGLMPKFRVDGRDVVVQYTSPFAKSQSNEDVMALQQLLATVAPLGPENLVMGLKTELIPEWVAKKSGVDMTLVRDETERQVMAKKTAEVAQTAMEQGVPIPGVTA